ncbi:MAG: stage II sporulation protein M [Candidatus Woesearchaeota archaeon]
MVFEQLFSADWIEKKPLFAFIIGISYSLLGIMSALIIFPNDIGIASLAFTSLLILPSLNQLLTLEENVEIRENKLSLKLLFKDHKDIFEVYIFLFFGIFLTYSFLTLVLPDLAVKTFFSTQLSVMNTTGQAIWFNSVFFWQILSNNFIVLFLCIVLSFLYGAGSILFLVWNASAWGSIFAQLAKQTADVTGQNHFIFFISLIAKVFPHTFLEALSYFFAIIAGGVISKAILREKFSSARFNHVLTDGLIFFGIAIAVLIIGAIIEVFVYSG